MLVTSDIVIIWTTQNPDYRCHDGFPGNTGKSPVAVHMGNDTIVAGGGPQWKASASYIFTFTYKDKLLDDCMPRLLVLEKCSLTN